MPQPIVSALTPTYNRRGFFAASIRYFLAQNYSPLEWIILDDGTDLIKDLLPDDPRIKYFHEQPKKNHGAKINRCFELMRGEIGIIWDDDDFYPRDRITRQIQPLIDDPALMVTGTSTLYYRELGTQRAFQYSRPTGAPVIVGGRTETPRPGTWLGAIAVRKTTWEKARWQEIAAGADYNFLKQVPNESQHDLNDPALVVATIHPTNACRKVLGREYRPIEWETIRALTNGDL